jgi:excisionase family DNA binding protein
VPEKEDLMLLSVKEAAGRLGISVPRVHDLIQAGTLPTRKISGVHVIDEADLAAAEQRNTRQGWPAGRPRKPRGVAS